MNQIGQFRNRINTETRRAIALAALSLDTSELKLNTLEGKRTVQKRTMDLKLLFKRFCSRKQLTDGGCFPLGSLTQFVLS